jgi:hypothetical protein
MRVHNIDHEGIWVRDLQGARTFSSKALGLVFGAPIQLIDYADRPSRLPRRALWGSRAFDWPRIRVTPWR